MISAKKNGVVPKLSSSPVAARARTSLAPPPSPRKPAPHRAPAQRPNTLPTNKGQFILLNFASLLRTTLFLTKLLIFAPNLLDLRYCAAI